MPIMPAESSPASWLGRTLANKRLEITELLARLRGMGAQNAPREETLQNMATVLDQISDEKKKEDEIIRKIEAIEAEHKARRHNHTLDEIRPKPEVLEAIVHNEVIEPPKPRNSLLWLLAFLALFNRPKKELNHK